MNPMRCPVCKGEIQITGQERLETLIEHVCDPNGEVGFKDKYECLNKTCPAIGKIFWNSYGERYGELDKSFFIDKNDGPFGSIERRLNAENNGPHWSFSCPLFWIQFKIRCVADTDGRILSRKPSISFFTKRWNAVGYSYRGTIG
jgi:hypothetical protein